MIVSYRWLQEFFDGTLPDPEKISHALTFGAYEVEKVSKTGDDFVFDIDVLPNRAHDSLCHRGIAKEIAVLMEIQMIHDPLVKEAPLTKKSSVLENTVDPDRCRRYSAAVIEGVSVGPSPDWLIKYLQAIGQRSINNIVDATNYVMLNIGQPLHAFDMDKLELKDDMYRIGVRPAKEGEKIETLDQETYDLSETVSLIVDANSDVPIGIAGIKGGKNTEVDDGTKNIIIEAANFNPKTTRRASQMLKLRTDASTRFENEISRELTSYGLRDVVALILDVAGGSLEGYTDVYPTPQKSSTVQLTVADTNSLLGVEIGGADIKEILTKLRFSFEKKGDTFEITAPFERLDINIKEDVVEEIGRVYGYDKIPAQTLETSQKPAINKSFYYAEKIRNFLVDQGFSEVYTYSFQDSGEVEVANPLARDKAFLRKSLQSGLEKSLALNEKNASLLGLERIKIFEIGTVFSKEQEHVSLGIAASVTKDDALVRSAMDSLFKELGIEKTSKTTVANGVVEINFDELLEKLPEPDHYEAIKESEKVSYKPISSYPFALRDIAVWVPKEISSDDVLHVIEEEAGELLVKNTLFDEYAKDDKTSYAYHLVFQSFEKTLSEEEIHAAMERITAAFNGRDNWEVR